MLGPQLLMLLVVSVAAVLAVAYVTLWAFKESGGASRSCALCRVEQPCFAEAFPEKADGACCCPQKDGDGCFTGTFGCPKGYTCYYDNTATGTCHNDADKYQTEWLTNGKCNAETAPCDVSAINSCCCMGGGPLGGKCKEDGPSTCVQGYQSRLAAVPMGYCGPKGQPSA
jgi:hypothetical protein